MLKRTLALVLSVALVTTGCASAGGPRPQTAPTTDPAVMAAYVQRLPIGSRVKVERSTGGSITGTLMGADASALVVQWSTEKPEPPVTVPLADVTRVTLDTGHPTALRIWAGVGVALTCLYVISALVIASAESSGR